MNVARRALLHTPPVQLLACSGSSFFLFPSILVLCSSRRFRLKLFVSDQSEVITRWPTVPCLCFRASTTCRRPSLGGERAERRTTALQSLWRRRWAGGSFKKVKLQFKPGAHLECFNVSRCFHRSQSCRPTFSERRTLVFKNKERML